VLVSREACLTNLPALSSTAKHQEHGATLRNVLVLIGSAARQVAPRSLSSNLTVRYLQCPGLPVHVL
jgi:hypothetical protein